MIIVVGCGNNTVKVPSCHTSVKLNAQCTGGHSAPTSMQGIPHTTGSQVTNQLLRKKYLKKAYATLSQYEYEENMLDCSIRQENQK